MNKIIWLAVLVMVSVTAGVVSQDHPDPGIEQAAIKAAALDYIDGALDGDQARIERAVHQELTKVSVRTFPQTGKQYLRKIGYSTMVELVRADAIHADPADRNIEVTIYSMREDLAAVKTTSKRFYDYLLMAKINDQWKLINVLWQANPDWKENPNRARQDDKPAADPAADKASIEQTCLNYIEGYFSGDADRMQGALHPELTKVRPQTLKQTGKIMLDKVGTELLVEATRTKMGVMDEADWKIDYKLLDYREDLAMVEIVSSMFIDYIQLARFNGEWKIINVLWAMNPDAPGRQK
jgi:hypothetical protein